ncbi:MAG: GNAT family N-acetyltransferase [Ruminococcaceae bacterium]|nr:GNAT family N-acetyltransferase [Oscillospiraceae bacterium]
MKEGTSMVSLRHFTEDDAETLRQKLWQDMPCEEVVRMIGDWNTLVFDGRYYEAFAVERDGAVVGMVSLYEHTASTVSLGVEIFGSERRKGCAAEAVAALLDHARGKGYRIAQDQVRADNAASIRLHEKLSFESDGYVYRNQKDQKVLLWWKPL